MHPANNRVSLLFIILFILSLMLAAPATAKDATKTLGLDEAIQMALAYSPRLDQSRADIKRAEYGDKEAFTNYLPTFNAAYTYVQRDDASPGVPNANFTFTPSINQPVFTGFRLDAQQRLAELGVDLAKVNLMLNRLDVVLDVKEKYFSYLQAQRNLVTAKQQVEQLQAQLKNAKDFYDVGIQPINEVLKVKVELANAEQQEVTARNSVSSSRAALARLVGLSVDYPLQIKDILDYKPSSITYDQAKNQARTFRPELKANQVELDQADQSIKAAKSEYWPSVNLTASYSRNSDSIDMSSSDYFDEDTFQATTSISWNFWEWGRTDYRVGSQRAGRQRLESVRKDLEDEIDLQVKQAYLFLKDSETNINTTETAVVQAEENYRITQERYREQLTTNTEVLDAQFLLTRARNNYNNTLATYNLALARLLRAMGQGLEPGK
jgi:outer membrane protein